MISETKIVESFVTCQFAINSFSDPFRIDQNINLGSRYYIYVRKDIHAQLLSTESIPPKLFSLSLIFLSKSG